MKKQKKANPAVGTARLIIYWKRVEPKVPRIQQKEQKLMLRRIMIAINKSVLSNMYIIMPQSRCSFFFILVAGGMCSLLIVF